MSGYLEVKYPSKSNLGLNPFKSWKRQWCILRPSPTFSGGILAVYCSEAGASAGTIELPAGFVVRRTKSRTRPHAFAVFPTDEPRKPRVLLAANTLHDAQVWMEKIRAQLSGNQMELESLKDTFSVTVTSTDLSRKCGLSGADCTVSVTQSGVLVSHSQKPAVCIQWKHISDTSLNNGDRNGTCILNVDSGFVHGSGSFRFTSPLAGALVGALQRRRGEPPSRPLSKSDGDLNKIKGSDDDVGEVRRSSWYSGPSEVSLDDLDLVMSKREHCLSGLSRCRGAGHLPAAPARPAPVSSLAFDDSMTDRRSTASVASGIYEEIPDLPVEASGPSDTGLVDTGPVDTGPTAEDGVYCKMSRDRTLGLLKSGPGRRHEPTYESVAECVYATLRARRPPPLPPRRTPDSKSCVTRHGSLGSLPPAAPAAPAARTLPRWDRSRHAFSAFRKRLKSDSRVTTSPKSETAKDKDVETKKKKFDFTPTRDIFKSFKVSRKMKNLKINSSLTKGETKSCEFLDETEHVKTNRCSKSVECLEGSGEYDEYDEYDNFDADLSLEYDPSAFSLPREIVELIIKGQEQLNQICSKDVAEGDYMPMSPIIPPPLEHHYIVMSPRTHIA